MNKRITFLIILLSIVTLLCAGCIGKSNVDSDDYDDSSMAVSSTSNAPKNYTNSIGMEFVPIPAGDFMMGSNESYIDMPVHGVTIEQDYYIGKYEVTQEQWVEVMGSNPSYSKGDSLPVENVSWNDVQEFIRKLNEMEGTNKYRLPSEAEWEYACRAGTTTRYSFGNNMSYLGDYAWYSDNSGYKTHSVGQKEPNPWGLYDIHGNVWEWCQDEWHPDYEGVPIVGGYEGAPSDGSAWEDGSSSNRIIRGGSMQLGTDYCRSAKHGLSYGVDSIYKDIGFRLLMEVSSSNSDNLSSADSDEDGDSSMTVSNTSKATKYYANSIGMKFVLIPAGKFMMGSPLEEEGRFECEGPVHEVTIEQDYYIGKYEVTQEQWVEVMGINPSAIFGENYAVFYVSWYDVQEFIRKLNEMEGTNKYRLPSEAEWEYACRAGTTTRYSFGNNESNLSDYACLRGHLEMWIESDDPSDQNYAYYLGLGGGGQKPNPWGLYQIHGGVSEWVQDNWHDSYIGAPNDGSAWEDSSSPYHVVRGGSFFRSSNECRSAYRRYVHYDGIGFRLLREV